MKRQSICLLMMAAVVLTACVQVQVVARGAESPMISFALIPSISPTGTALATFAAVAMGHPSPTLTAPSTPTDIPTATATTLPAPTATAMPTPTPCPPDARFVGDVTVPDGTVVLPGEVLVKVWRMQSSGCVPWPAGSRWVLVGGARMGAPEAVAVPDTPLGGTTEISVTLIAPEIPGTYTNYWRMQAPDGSFFGQQAYVQIVVAAFTPPPTPPGSAPTSEPTPEPPPDTPTPTPEPSPTDTPTLEPTPIPPPP